MEIGREIFSSLFSVNSVWSVVFRGLIWFAVAVVIIASTDTPNPQRSLKSLKSNLGFLMMFIVLSSGLMYLLFGMAPTA